MDSAPLPQSTKRPRPVLPLLMIIIGLCILGSAGYFFVYPRITDSCMRESNAIHETPGMVGLGPYITDRTRCYTDKAIQQNDERICMKISRNNQELLLVSCITQIAETKNDASVCNRIPETDDRINCAADVKQYNLIWKYQGNANINAEYRRTQLQKGWTQIMQENADRQFSGTPFSWTIQFQLVDETAQYIDCKSKGTMLATMKDRAPWDALNTSDKEALVRKLLADVYGWFGSVQVVDVMYNGQLLAHGDFGCGNTLPKVILQ